MDIGYSVVSNNGGRKVNEDFAAMASVNGAGCFVLCDGLGGQGKGDAASSLVANSILQSFYNTVNYETFVGDSMAKAQEQLRKRKIQEHEKTSMLTTAVVLLLYHGQAIWGHVGDSRLYLFQNGEMVTRTLDHSIPQLQVFQGIISEDEIRTHKDRNRLLKAMGDEWTKPQFEICDKKCMLEEGQSFLLCSDGFWEMIEEKDMIRCLEKSASAEEWIQRMEKQVLENGKTKKMDNYSAIAVFIR